MKKNILTIFIILSFVFTTFGKPPNRRAHDNIYEKFITQKLELLGMKAGKITKVGNAYIIIVNTFSPKTNALRRTKPFRSFSLKVTLQGIKPDTNTKMGLVMEEKKMKPGLKGKRLNNTGINPDLNTKMGVIMEDKKMKSDPNKKMGLIIEDKKMKSGLNTKMGIIMEDRKMKQIYKNLKLLINKKNLLGANFVIGDTGMPKGIIVQ